MADVNLEDTDTDHENDHIKFTLVREREQESHLESIAEKYFSKKRAQISSRKNEIDTADESDTDEDKPNFQNFKVSYEVIRDTLRDSHQIGDAKNEKTSCISYQYQDQFAKWLLYLSEGFNLLLQGYGSKISTLDDFCCQQLDGKFNYFSIRAYNTNLRLKAALENLAEKLGVVLPGKSSSSSSVIRMASEIRDYCQISNEFDVVLVIYCIDGPILRSEECQIALSCLAEAPNLRLIATLDNINTPVLWDAEMIEKFRWLSVDVTTYKTYFREILAADESRVLGLNKKSKFCAHNLASLESVWLSLTGNARQIFKILADHHLATKKKQSNSKSNKNSTLTTSFMFWDLYKICRDEFLISYEPALRQQLTEFEDHRLISRKSAEDGAELIELCVEDGILTDFLEQIAHEK